MGNPFTDESRDSRFKVDVPGLMDTLRAPESLHRLVMEFKPAVVSTGDFALKGMLDSCMYDKTRTGGRSGLVFMRPVGGQFSANPAHDVSNWIRRKLYAAKFPPPVATIYDAEGKAVATYDPETCKRTPLPERSEASQ